MSPEITIDPFSSLVSLNRNEPSPRKRLNWLTMVPFTVRSLLISSSRSKSRYPSSVWVCIWAVASNSMLFSTRTSPTSSISTSRREREPLIHVSSSPSCVEMFSIPFASRRIASETMPSARERVMYELTTLAVITVSSPSSFVFTTRFPVPTISNIWLSSTAPTIVSLSHMRVNCSVMTMFVSPAISLMTSVPVPSSLCSSTPAVRFCQPWPAKSSS